MARLILKSPYIKPKRSAKAVGRYIRYIATRAGVDKIKNQRTNLPVTKKQEQIIKELLDKYPDCKKLYENEDFTANPSRQNADELILQISELNPEVFDTKGRYIEYIASRRGAEKISEHGLFSDIGKKVILSRVSDEVNGHDGNIWTHIISLRREDAVRLGYDNAERWQTLLCSHRNLIAENMKIMPNNFRWYAAFHNEGNHPHVHMVAYSINPKEAYLSKKGIEKIKSSLAQDIFTQDLFSYYEVQTEHRNKLRGVSREAVRDIVKQINSGSYDNPKLEELLLNLSEKLSESGGKKVYGYLKADEKAIVNGIVDLLSADKRISKLYDLWYEQKENILRIYSDDLPKRVPLSQNPEFKSIRNAVIKESLRLADLIYEDSFKSDNKDNNEKSEEKTTSGHSNKTSNNSYSSHAAEGIIQLLRHVSNIIADKTYENQKPEITDRKALRKIRDKKQAKGQRMV